MSMETKPPVAPDGDLGPTDSPQGYEHSDASIPGLLKFAVGLAVLLVIVLAGMKWTFSYFARMEPLGPPASPFQNARVLPPNPRLQVEPHLELKDYCEAQERELTSYGWVDQRDGTVRIPVDRAMQLVLERGLPTRPANEKRASTADPLFAGEVPQGRDVLGPCGYLAARSGQGAKR